MKWYQKELRGYIVNFWVTDPPLVSKRAKQYGLDKIAKQVRENR